MREGGMITRKATDSITIARQKKRICIAFGAGSPRMCRPPSKMANSPSAMPTKTSIIRARASHDPITMQNPMGRKNTLPPGISGKARAWPATTSILATTTNCYPSVGLNVLSCRPPDFARAPDAALIHGADFISRRLAAALEDRKTPKWKRRTPARLDADWALAGHPDGGIVGDVD